MREGRIIMMKNRHEGKEKEDTENEKGGIKLQRSRKHNSSMEMGDTGVGIIECVIEVHGYAIARAYKYTLVPFNLKASSYIIA